MTRYGTAFGKEDICINAPNTASCGGGDAHPILSIVCACVYVCVCAQHLSLSAIAQVQHRSLDAMTSCDPGKPTAPEQVRKFDRILPVPFM